MALLFHYLSAKRKHKLQTAAFKLSVPVIIIGNISVGGTGKTPALISLSRYLSQQGLSVGIVSRGYGRVSTGLVISDDATGVKDLGDEPFLIYTRTGLPVAVCEDRILAAQSLINHGCNVILADDGLQQYRLYRDIEIVMVDSQRMLGNEKLLPVGPLREKPSRLQSADYVLVNFPSNRPCDSASFSEFLVGQNGNMAKKADCYAVGIDAVGLTQLSSGKRFSVSKLQEGAWVAVAGLGNPQKFFKTLESCGAEYKGYVFPDHYAFSEEDFAPFRHQNIVMTEKDAVKCQAFSGESWYQLDVDMYIPEEMLLSLSERLHHLSS